MKKLSINIPTYNRDSFLQKNLLIIIKQLRKGNLVDSVEINISDNASTDNTEAIVLEIAKANQDIDFHYQKKEKNYGPDMNFISAMKMAHGEYSILFGDDDFFEDGVIERIFQVINNNNDVSFFLSNRISVNADDKSLGEHKYMKEHISTEKFDFSNKNDIRAYFSQTADHGGILTFISSVIYKTCIIKEIGDYDERCTGSCYSFLYYWWSSLLRGKKLLYLDEYWVRATVTGVTNNNYGTGLKRVLVDTEGLSLIADIVFVKDLVLYKDDFLSAVRRPISVLKIYSAIKNDNLVLVDRFFRSMEKCGWPIQDIKGWKYMMSRKNTIKSFLKAFLPSFLSTKIRF